MTWRDAAGGYLTGNESESVFDSDDVDDIWDEDEEEEPDDARTVWLWRRWHALEHKRRRLEASLGPMPEAQSFDPEDLAPDEADRQYSDVIREQDDIEWDLQQRGYPIGGPPPPADAVETVEAEERHGSRRRTANAKLPKPEDILRPRLTDEQYRHWLWIDQGLGQVEIAKRLGISQAAVSKREKSIRRLVDQAYVDATGSGYRWVPISNGGRPRRR